MHRPLRLPKVQQHAQRRFLGRKLYIPQTIQFVYIRPVRKMPTNAFATRLKTYQRYSGIRDVMAFWLIFIGSLVPQQQNASVAADQLESLMKSETRHGDSGISGFS